MATDDGVRYVSTANLLRDAGLVTRRLLRAPVFVAVTVATLTLGLGMFAVVYTAVDKVLVEPMPYPNPEGLYLLARLWTDPGSKRCA